jgi:holliday junction DNA helicase RuvB
MRVLNIDELIGNKPVKLQLVVAHGAARLHNRPLPHVLLAGAPGCGKTSTAKAIARLRGSYFVQASAEGLKTEEMAKIFSSFPDEGYSISTGEIIGTIEPPVLFIDEAHRLTLKTQEMLGIAMENFQHTFSQGRGKQKQTVTTWIPKFTVVCATTKEGKLSKPFRDRFKLTYVFNTYSMEESIEILQLHAEERQIKIDEASIAAIARRGRGTPRLLVRYLERVDEQKTFIGKQAITVDMVEEQFKLMLIDAIGLTESDITVLKTLYDSGGPVGIETLAVKTFQDKDTISDVNEPYLVRLGFMERGKSGRVITDLGVKHLAKTGQIKTPEKEEVGRIIHRRKYKN